MAPSPDSAVWESDEKAATTEMSVEHRAQSPVCHRISPHLTHPPLPSQPHPPYLAHKKPAPAPAVTPLRSQLTTHFSTPHSPLRLRPFPALPRSLASQPLRNEGDVTAPVFIDGIGTHVTEGLGLGMVDGTAGGTASHGQKFSHHASPSAISPWDFASTLAASV
ncbi:hypothetical protein VC83_08038 [Pseudogymnoascus destructans]|uniref:Uncharacterized protein n=1 Tax=Pseudogymnoascus destructans TaxID=655981 RepID=A0A177A103_9PEZI|nr:uncharacterized protein VC83_08038 [Pseudogymnoascus destructans]OAF55856.1 hypothetical protein VC83_08038 [Pseudogymnoascus destructans]